MKKQRLQGLFRSLQTQNAKTSLVRITTSASLADYISWVGAALVVFTTFFVCCLNVLALALDPKVWLAWRLAGWVYFAHTFLNQPAANTSQPAFEMIGLCIMAFVFACISYGYARKEFKTMLGLLAYTRSHQVQATLPEKNALTIPEAPWIFPEPINNVTPADMLQVVEENPGLWQTALAIWTQKHPPEPSPLANIQIRISNKCEIVLIGQNSTTATFFLNKAKYTELLAFFALQPHRDWIAKADFVPPLYGNKARNFAVDVQRLHQEITKVAYAHNLIPLERALLGKKHAPEEICILEKRTIHGTSCWRLHPGCSVEIFPELQKGYAKALDAQTQQHPINLAEQEQLLVHMVNQYGASDGLMGSYQKKGAWEWLKETYHQYRLMWIFLLKDTAQREIQQSQDTTDEACRQKSLQQAALFYSWAITASEGLFPRLLLPTTSGRTEAEHCLIEALTCYHKLKDQRSARILAHNYRNRRPKSWKPTQAMEEAWPGIFDPVSSKKQARRKAQ